MMRLRNQTNTHKSKYHALHPSSNDNTLYTSSDDKNLVQRYWPCFAIIACCMLFTTIIYTTVFLTQDAEYPICSLPESLLFPTEQQTFLTYIYPRDASNIQNKINNKFTQNEKQMFLSTLQHLYNQETQTLNTINTVQHRLIKDCNFKPKHCVQFQLIYAPNRAHKDSQHKTINIDYNKGIVQLYDDTQNAFNFHKIDPNELLMTISLNTHDFDINRNKWFGSIRNFIGLDSNQLKEMKNDENIGYFSCIDWHKTRLYHGFHAVFLNPYPIGNYSGLFVPDFWNNHGQYLDFRVLLLAIQFLNLFPMESTMRIGFNSIAAFASVNHLHFQFWNIGQDNDGLPIEFTPIKELATKGMGRIQINEMDYDYYPLHGLQYQLNVDRVSKDNALYSDLQHLTRIIFYCVEHLQRNNIAYNMLMVPGYPFKIWLIPRQTQAAFDGFDEFVTKPGFPDVSGHLMLVNEDEWKEITVEQIWKTWRERISINHDNEWMEITKECLMIDM